MKRSEDLTQSTKKLRLLAINNSEKPGFENRLNATGVVVDQIQIIGRVEGDQSKFLIIGKVSNHPEGLNLIGWELSLQNGIIVFDSTGPG
ncbi:MAG: hypothetical protein R2792_18320 [Saprospiraceae bacterium]